MVGKGGGTRSIDVGNPLRRNGPESHVTRLGVIDRSVVISSIYGRSFFKSSVKISSVLRRFMRDSCDPFNAVVVVGIGVEVDVVVNTVDALWNSKSISEGCATVFCTVAVSRSVSPCFCTPVSIRSNELSNPPPSPENGSLNV